MSMSRRDFEAIAKIIRENTTKSVEEAQSFVYTSDLVDQLADYLLSQNPRFDYDRFYNACQAKEYEC